MRGQFPSNMLTERGSTIGLVNETKLNYHNVDTMKSRDKGKLGNLKAVLFFFWFFDWIFNLEVKQNKSKQKLVAAMKKPKARR